MGIRTAQEGSEVNRTNYTDLSSMQCVCLGVMLDTNIIMCTRQYIMYIALQENIIIHVPELRDVFAKVWMELPCQMLVLWPLTEMRHLTYLGIMT